MWEKGGRQGVGERESSVLRQGSDVYLYIYICVYGYCRVAPNMKDVMNQPLTDCIPPGLPSLIMTCPT